MGENSTISHTHTHTYIHTQKNVTRIVYYLSVSQLLMIPLMIRNIADEGVKMKLKLAVMVVGILYFALFVLSAHQAGVGLLPYRTWLFEERYLYK